GKDAELAQDISKRAADAGYASPAYWAAQNLKDPLEIARFTDLYVKTQPEIGPKNIDMAIQWGGVEPGTEGAWQAGLDRALQRQTPASAPESAGPLGGDARSDMDFLHRISKGAEKTGTSPLEYGLRHSEELGDIERTTRLYHDNYGEAATDKIRQAVGKGQ